MSKLNREAIEFNKTGGKKEIMATIRYLVYDVNVSIEFYTKHLGFKFVEQTEPAFAIVTKGDLNIWLSGPQTSAARSMPDGRKPAPGGWNRFVIEVEDIQALVTSMKSAGISFRNEIITGPGGKQILAEDTPRAILSKFSNLLNFITRSIRRADLRARLRCDWSHSILCRSKRHGTSPCAR